MSEDTTPSSHAWSSFTLKLPSKFDISQVESGKVSKSGQYNMVAEKANFQKTLNPGTLPQIQAKSR